MEPYERIVKLIDYLGLNKNSFSEAVGMTTNVTIGRIVNEKRRPSVKTLEKITSRFPQISYDWLLTGRGEMLMPEFTADARPVNVETFMYVPLIPVRASAGYLTGYGDTEYIESLPSLPVVVDKQYKGKYRLFEVEGDSMDDGTRGALCDKDIVLGREVKRELWQNKLHINNWNFIIVHRTEGITIKRILEHNTEDGSILCHPVNPLYEDFTLYLDEVLELYNVIKIVDRNARI